MARVSIGITTYNRQRECWDVISDVYRCMSGHDVRCHIIDDCSDHLGWPVSDAYGYDWLRYYKHTRNYGKQLFWRTITQMFERWKHDDADYYIYLQDDGRLCDDFITRAVERYESIPCARKSMLTLDINNLTDRERGRWTKLRTKHHTFNGFAIDRIGWVDAWYICERSTLEALKWRVNEVSPNRWRRKPNLSSGVNDQLSKRLHSAGRTMWQVRDSLVYYRQTESQMNKEDRASQPAYSLGFLGSSELPGVVTDPARKVNPVDVLGDKAVRDNPPIHILMPTVRPLEAARQIEKLLSESELAENRWHIHLTYKHPTVDARQAMWSRLEDDEWGVEIDDHDRFSSGALRAIQDAIDSGSAQYYYGVTRGGGRPSRKYVQGLFVQYGMLSKGMRAMTRATYNIGGGLRKADAPAESYGLAVRCELEGVKFDRIEDVFITINEASGNLSNDEGKNRLRRKVLQISKRARAELRRRVR